MIEGDVADRVQLPNNLKKTLRLPVEVDLVVAQDFIDGHEYTPQELIADAQVEFESLSSEAQAEVKSRSAAIAESMIQLITIKNQALLDLKGPMLNLDRVNVLKHTEAAALMSEAKNRFVRNEIPPKIIRQFCGGLSFNLFLCREFQRNVNDALIGNMVRFTSLIGSVTEVLDSETPNRAGSFSFILIKLVKGSRPLRIKTLDLETYITEQGAFRGVDRNGRGQECAKPFRH